MKPSHARLFGSFAALNLLLSPLAAHAQSDGRNGGGTAEQIFSGVATEIKSWIAREGHRSLKLPTGVSFSNYSEKMTAAMNAAVITFTSETILIQGVVKTCENFYSVGIPTIRCNETKFKNGGARERFALIHHEYAGLAGFEVNEGPNSNYEISNQIDQFLEATITYRLKAEIPVPAGYEKIDVASPYAATFNGGVNLANKKDTDAMEAIRQSCDQEGNELRAKLDQMIGANHDAVVSPETRNSTEMGVQKTTCWITFVFPRGTLLLKDVNVRSLAEMANLQGSHRTDPQLLVSYLSTSYKEGLKAFSEEELLNSIATKHNGGINYGDTKRETLSSIFVVAPVSNLPPVVNPPAAAAEFCAQIQNKSPMNVHVARDGTVWKAREINSWDGKRYDDAEHSCEGKFLSDGRYQITASETPARVDAAFVVVNKTRYYQVAGHQLSFYYKAPATVCSQYIRYKLAFDRNGNLEKVTGSAGCQKIGQRGQIKKEWNTVVVGVDEKSYLNEYPTYPKN